MAAAATAAAAKHLERPPSPSQVASLPSSPPDPSSSLTATAHSSTGSSNGGGAKVGRGGCDGDGWRNLGAPPAELRLEVTLENGQVFSWDRIGETMWSGVLRDRVVSLRETPADVAYKVAPRFGSNLEAQVFHEYLVQYFNLHDHKLVLEEISREWNEKEPERLGPICKDYLRGMRLLRQDPFECTIAFICSSNNNIKRIKLMLSNLRKTYGKPLKMKEGVISYQFPTVERLSCAKEERLRKLGFGYRAKYIVQAAQLIKDKGGKHWLQSLRKKTPEQVREALLELPGVGPKVADCIALFCLDQFAIVPVDTHVWQLVEREFKHVIAGAKTLTKRVYGEISNFFQEKFGSHCGWAHSFLFAAELPHFRSRLPKSLQPVLSPKTKKSKSFEKAETKVGRLRTETPVKQDRLSAERKRRSAEKKKSQEKMRMKNKRKRKKFLGLGSKQTVKSTLEARKVQQANSCELRSARRVRRSLLKAGMLANTSNVEPVMEPLL